MNMIRDCKMTAGYLGFLHSSEVFLHSYMMVCNPIFFEAMKIDARVDCFVVCTGWANQSGHFERNLKK
jgi:hypothetical protein